MSFVSHIGLREKVNKKIYTNIILSSRIVMSLIPHIFVIKSIKVYCLQWVLSTGADKYVDTTPD
jgi:hypothetical protein